MKQIGAGVLMVLLIGRVLVAGPATNPATTANSTTRPAKLWRSAKQIIDAIPRNVRPPKDVRWRSLDEQRVNDWLKSDIVGDQVNVAAEFDHAKLEASRQKGTPKSMTLRVYAREHFMLTTLWLAQHIPKSLRGVDDKYMVGYSFELPPSDAEQIQQIKPKDRVTLRGTIADITCTERQMSIRLADVKLTD